MFCAVKEVKNGRVSTFSEHESTSVSLVYLLIMRMELRRGQLLHSIWLVFHLTRMHAGVAPKCQRNRECCTCYEELTFLLLLVLALTNNQVNRMKFLFMKSGRRLLFHVSKLKFDTEMFYVN